MYANILLPLKLGSTLPELTYAIPPELFGKIEEGMAVRVPVQNRTYTGIVTKIHEHGLATAAERPASAVVKAILAVKEGGEILEAWQIELAKWMAEHYFSPFYKVLKLMLPERLWAPSSTEIPYTLLYERTETPIPARLGPKAEELIKLFDQKPRYSRKELETFSLQTLKSLETKGLLKKIKGAIAATEASSKNTSQFPSPAKILTPEQATIIDAILASTSKFLLHGVTGSGKTEIYLRLAEAMTQHNKQTILLVPEIALTPQLIDYFRESFGEKIAVMHSQLSAGEREREWWRVQTGAATLIIGSRSAIFAPVKNLGLIILDEEHEGSYKQDQTPYYHARDVAFKMGELTGAKVLLGSATPSLETAYATEQGELKKFTLQRRINGNESLPPVHLVDMREELRKGNFSMFSDRLIEKLEKTLAAKEQVILFLNRRGHSTAVVCRECGQGSKCPHCEVSFTHHRFKDGGEILVCHHCNRREPVPLTCPRCHSRAIKFLGVGTEKVEVELQKRFPTARILRADRDTTRRKDSFKKIYETFKAGEADILLGTQIIGKGLDLPNVTLVGVILADVGLHLPDFRAGERTFQLMTQVAGRSGRAEKPGEVVIQTYNPEHPSLQAAAHHDYTTFYSQEIAARKALHYPPFSRTVELTFRHDEQKKCSEEARRIAGRLRDAAAPNYKIDIDTAPAIIPRLHNKYRWHVTLRGENPSQMLKQFLEHEKLPEGWSIDAAN